MVRCTYHLHFMKIKERPFYRKKYQLELAETLTGKPGYLIRQIMRRKEIDLSEAIKYYLKKV